MGNHGAVQQIFPHHIGDDLPERLENAQLYLLDALTLWRTAVHAAFEPLLELRLFHQFVGGLSLKCAEIHLDQIVHSLDLHVREQDLCGLGTAPQRAAVHPCHIGILELVHFSCKLGCALVGKRKIGSADVNALVVCGSSAVPDHADAITFHKKRNLLCKIVGETRISAKPAGSVAE